MSDGLPDDQLPPTPSPAGDDDLTPPSPASVKAPLAPQADPGAPPPPPVSSFALTDDELPPAPQEILTELPDKAVPPPPDATQPIPAKETALPATPEPILPQPPIAPPTQTEVPTEAAFPGQPVPESQQKDLEKKAEELIEQTGGKVSGKPPSKAVKTILGVLALGLVVGSGIWAGSNLLGRSTENRGQAIVDTTGPACPNNPDNKDLCDVSTCGYDADGNAGVEGFRYCQKEPYKHCRYVCGEMKIYRCCDGTSINSTGTGEEACVNRGGYNDCTNVEVVKCTCESWSNACGTNCKFPDDTNCQAEADRDCTKYIAVCEILSGSTHCEKFTPDHRCWGQEDVCKNPVFTPNCAPPPTPTPPPLEPSLACETIGVSLADVNLGDTVDFTCTARAENGAAIHHFEFEYRNNNSAWQSLAETSLGSGRSQNLVIANPGAYAIRCRACQTADQTKCTAYQEAE
jgi:hypothetical protein